MKRTLYGAVVGMMILTATGLAQFLEFVGPQVPFERLIKNTTSYIKEHPADAMGPYTLARIHFLALALRAPITGMPEASEDRLPTINESSSIRHRPVRQSPPAEKSALSNDELREHLTEAILNYRKAIQMDPDDGLFHLGLASVSEAALSAGFTLGAIPGAVSWTAPKDGDFTTLWREQAIAEYLKAFELSIAHDTASDLPLEGLYGWISYEAGEAYVTMVTARGPSFAERQTIQKIDALLKTLRAKPITSITPIVFRLSGARPLADLLDLRRTVEFDLDGTGLQQRYTWLRPDTGILVWDPSNEGTVTSGHQLFGSVSFHMFWPDGYRALDVLDDNRDGELRGDELAGLAVWFDRNQNGVSDPGEVAPINQTGIVALSARATSSVGASLANETGLVLKDGRILPTYDWTTTPLKEEPATSPKSPRS